MYTKFDVLAVPLWSRLRTSVHTSKYMMLLHDAEPDDLLLIQLLSSNKLNTSSPEGKEISLPLSFLQNGGFIAEETNRFYHDFVFPPLIKDGLLNSEETTLTKIPGPSALNPLNSKFSAMFDTFRGRETMNAVRKTLQDEYDKKLQEICKKNGRADPNDEDQFWVTGEMMPTEEALIKSRDDIVNHIEQKGTSPLLIVSRPFIELAYEFTLSSERQKLHRTLSKYNAAILQYSGFNYRENLTYLTHNDKEMLAIRSNDLLSRNEKAKLFEARKEAFCQFYHSSTKTIIVVEMFTIYNGLGFAQPKLSQDYMLTHRGQNIDVLKSYICDFNTGFVMRLNDYIPRFLKSRFRAKESKLCLQKFEILKEKAKELEKMTIPDPEELELFTKRVKELEEFAVSTLEDEKQAKLNDLAQDSVDERKLIEEHFETRKSRVKKQFNIYQGVALCRLVAIGLVDPALMLVLLGDPSITSRLTPVIPSGYLHDHLTYKAIEEGSHKAYASFVTKLEGIEEDEERKSRELAVAESNNAIDSALDRLILKTISNFPSTVPAEGQTKL